MYEAFFEMTNTPFVKNVPVSSLYIPPFIEEAQGRLTYGVDNNLFIVVTGDPGCGKSTLIRALKDSLSGEDYIMLYLADSKLTPRWFYSGLLNQLGLQPRFYRGDAKRQLQRELEIIRGVQHKKVICVLDEAHLLDKETLEEFRFMLNYRFDSESPMGLILVGQTELWDQKLRYQNYAAIRQRIDMNIVLRHLDRAETGMYIDAHLVYAGGKKDIFTDRAIDEVFKSTNGIPRMINRVCEKTLMYASQQQKRLIDEHMVQYVTEHEMLKGGGI
jgi:type II secretory pathway predicted ATPase ExeA